jgi:hypothetical protein
MKVRRALFIPLWLAACTSTSQVSNEPVDRCETTDCFNQQQVRNFEIVDETTLVVYVGNQNCPFRVEFSGAFCDLTFLPGTDLVFRPDTMRAIREPDNISMRVCSRDTNLGIDEGPFSTAPGGDDFPDDRNPCRIRDIASLTDDELLELYVEKRITAPPPPFGTGEITVPDEPVEEGEAAEGNGAAQSANEAPVSGEAPVSEP